MSFTINQSAGARNFLFHWNQLISIIFTKKSKNGKMEKLKNRKTKEMKNK